MYLSGGNFTSVFPKSSLFVFLFDFDLAESLLRPPLGVKEMGPLCEGPSVMSLSLYE